MNFYDEAIESKHNCLRKLRTKAASFRKTRGGWRAESDLGIDLDKVIANQEGDIRGLQTANTYFWEPRITQMVLASGQQLPQDVKFQPSWLAAPSGWWWFGRSSPLVALSKDSEKKYVHALFYRLDGERVHIATYSFTGSNFEELGSTVWLTTDDLSYAISQLKAACNFKKGSAQRQLNDVLGSAIKELRLLIQKSNTLMRKVVTAKLNALMNATGRFAFSVALRLRQCALFFAKEPRIRNLLAGAEGCEVRQPNIDTNCFTVRPQYVRFNLNRKAGEPFSSRRSRNSQCLDLALNRSVHLDVDAPNLRELYTITINAEAKLGIGQGIISDARMETGKPRFLPLFDPAKERLKRLVHPMQYILKSLRIDIGQLGTFTFNFRQLFRLGAKTYRLTVDAPSVPTFLKRSVIQFATQSELRAQYRLLSLRRIDSILKSSYYLCCHAERVSITLGFGWLGGFASVEPFCILAYF